MKFNPKKLAVKKFQMGGEMAPEEVMTEETVEEAPAAQQQQDPIMMIAQAAMQALQSQDCQMAMQVCQAFLQLVQQTQQAPTDQGEPVFAKNGAKLVRRIRK